MTDVQEEIERHRGQDEGDGPRDICFCLAREADATPSVP
jgi:hypothetical protein